jgi:hypothetical protein
LAEADRFIVIAKEADNSTASARTIMILDSYPQTLVLTGPTGCGKSQLALDLAERFDAEIVSMDSMALHRHIDIGTAGLAFPPIPEELAARLTEQGEWLFSTREIDASPYDLQHYVFEFLWH